MAELSAERLRALPGSWSYGISQGGRVFFINEEAKSTTWLHPLTGEAVITGHRRSADLPTGWEEAYTFEGARYYVNHNERKVTCKHPVTGQPSQDNCIFVVNEQTAAAMSSEEKKERPVSMICEATNYNLTSDYAAHPMSPVGRTSRSSKKVHNFGKRSNSIKRNPNAPVVRRGWLYKQDSTGMKLWKKRWFVLSDLCLFYYRDEKEEGILGSILLPSFQISVLTAEDHITRKYAFKAAHPNMRTYYFCTDTGKEMELWMKAMIDAALVQTEPVKRIEKFSVENTSPREANSISNHRVLIKPEAQNNQKNKEASRNEEKKALEAEKYGFQKVGQDKPLTKINSVKLNPLGCGYRTLPISSVPGGQPRAVNGAESRALGLGEPAEHRALPGDGAQLGLRDGAQLGLRDGAQFGLRDGTQLGLRDGAQLSSRDGAQLGLRDGAQLGLRDGAQLGLRDGTQLGLRDGTQLGLRDGAQLGLRDGTQLGLRDGAQLSSRDGTQLGLRDGAQLSSRDGAQLSPGDGAQLGSEPPRLVHRTSSMLQLEQWIRAQRGRGQDEETRGITSYQTLPRNMPSHRAQVLPRYPEGYRTLPRNSKARPDSLCSVAPCYERAAEDKRRSMRDDTMWQLYEWQQRQFYSKQGTLGRHGALGSPKGMASLCEQPLGSIPTSPSHGSLAGFQPFSPQRAFRSELSSPVQRGDVTMERRHRTHHSKHVFVPDRRSMPAALTLQPVTPQSLQGKTPEELTLLLIKLRRQQAELSSIREHTLAQLMQLKLEASSPKNEILSHHLQRNAIYLDHQMKENEPLITMVHTMIENSALRPQLYHQLTQEECRGTLYKYRAEELDIDAKLSRLCEQDKVVQALEEKLQQLHKEKYTVEQALVSASQEIERSAEGPAALQSVVLQREDLHNGLLSTCRELARASAELERAWREYDKLEYDVTVTRNHMQEQLDRLGEIQTESAGIQRAQIQKELWRIQDVMEGLLKHKQQRSSSEAGIMVSRTFSSIKYKNEEEEVVPPRPPLPRSYDFTEHPPIIPPLPSDSSSLLCYSRGPVHLTEEKRMYQVQGYQRNGSYCGPDYRLYKSEPELTTVAEVDESNGEEKTEPVSESESSGKGSHFPVGVVPPRTKSPTPESSTIASYVTLRKNKKIDLRTERPRSAVEQLCLAEGPRPRMPLQEQMERIRRHQQACLRERRKGLSILGVPEQSPSQGSSSARDSPFRLAQKGKKEDAVAANMKESESTSRENNLKQNNGSPGEEIEELKNDGDEEHNSSFTEELSKTDDLLSDAHVVSDSKEVSDEEKAEKKNKLEETHDGDISLQSVTTVANHKPKTSSEESEILSVQEQEGIVSSFELAAQSSKGNQAAAVKSLPSSPESSLSPAASTQTQLTEGSHFMCV